MTSTPPLATRAPESDVTSATTSPHVPAVQSNPAMGDHCTTDRPLSSSTSTPSGELTQFNSIDVYISKPADYPHSASKVLLLLTPGTGVKSINNQLQADKYASEGFVVVMPDQFGGDPAPNSATAAATATAEEPENSGAGSGGQEEEVTGGDVSIIEQVKLRAAETAKSFLLDMWLARHTSEKVLPILHKVLESVRDEFADAVANGGGVYAAGYCFGGKYVAMLAGQRPDTVMAGQVQERDEEEGMVKSGPLIKAGAIAHATLMTAEDMTSIQAPVSLVCVENDQLFPGDVLEQGRSHLQTHNIPHEIQTYPNVPHGFAVTGEYGDNQTGIKEAQHSAFQQMLAWLQSH